MGRGNRVTDFPGNLNFRRVCWKYKASYLAAVKENKQVIAQQVLAEIAALQPPGRVLERTADKKFVVADAKRAIEKTCQLLREKNTKRPEGMPTLPKQSVNKKSESRVRRVATSTKQQHYNDDSDSDYEEDEKPKAAKVKKAVKHPKRAKKKSAPKAKKNTTKKAGNKVKPADTKTSATKSSSTKIAKAKKAKKTPAKSKKIAIASSPGKPAARKSIGKSPRRSMRIALSKSAKEHGVTDSQESHDPSTGPPLETVTFAAAAPRDSPQSANGSVAARWQSPMAVSRPLFPVPGRPVMAFEEAPSVGDRRESFTLMPAPEIPCKELLRGFSEYSVRDGVAVSTGDDDFEKEIEGIEEPPLTSLVARGISLCSVGRGTTSADETQRESPQGVHEIGPALTALKPCNSLFVEGIEGSAAHASIGPAVFEKDDGQRAVNRTKTHNLWH